MKFRNLFKRKLDDIQEGAELSFYQELEDDYYSAYPELWGKEDHHAIGLRFLAILEGRTDRVSVLRYKGERATSSYIKRGKRKLWVVNEIYKVSEQMNSSSEDKSLGGNKREFCQTIGPSEAIGSIQLIKIIPGKTENVLIFKVVK